MTEGAKKDFKISPYMPTPSSNQQIKQFTEHTIYFSVALFLTLSAVGWKFPIAGTLSQRNCSRRIMLKGEGKQYWKTQYWKPRRV